MATDPALWRPTVKDVADVVPTRTAEPGGGPGATFTALTLPTDNQVEGLIAGIQSEVATAVGDVPVELTVPMATASGPGGPGTSPAGHVVALGAGFMVERDFYPDAQGPGGPAALLWQQYQAALKALSAAVDAIGGGADPGDALMPSWSFPDTVARGLATTPWDRW